jgi:RimJ/RimL family protein N-acetyltransferase
MQVPSRLTTERLYLRKPVREDARLIYDGYARDPEVTRYLAFRAGQTLEDVEEFLERALRGWDAGTLLTWAITLRPEGTLIGMIDVRLESHANVGYVLAREYWNRGYMTETLRALVSWATQQPEIFRLWAVCDVENTASARVMEKAGMECEGILRRWMVLPNRSDLPRDCYCYSIVK